MFPLHSTFRFLQVSFISFLHFLYTPINALLTFALRFIFIRIVLLSNNRKCPFNQSLAIFLIDPTFFIHSI